MAGTICHCDAVLMDPDCIEGLEKGFKRLLLAPATTLLRKHLSKRVFHLLRYKCTPLGANLYDAVRIGMQHHDSLCGAFAPDQYAYDTYNVLLDPLLDERHFGFELTSVHPPDDWGYKRIRKIQPLDPKNKYIISTRVRCSRNLDSYRFTPTMTPEELQEVEKLCVELLYKLPWEYSGNYLPIQFIPMCLMVQLARDHCFFDPADKYEITGNVRSHWPTGRGVYFNNSRSFAVLINEKDHYRVIALGQGEDLIETYRKVACVTPVLDRRLIPAVHERLGYLTVCPGDVGTGLRISVLMRIPADVPREALAEVARIYHLEVKYINRYGKDVACVSNLRTLGRSQYEVLKDFHHGLRELIMVTDFHSTGIENKPEEQKVPENIQEEEEEMDECVSKICGEGGGIDSIMGSNQEGNVLVKDEEEPGNVYEIEARAHRKARECIRAANRRKIARALCEKAEKDMCAAKDRLFPKRKITMESVDSARTLSEFKEHGFGRSINDRKCVSFTGFTYPKEKDASCKKKKG